MKHTLIPILVLLSGCVMIPEDARSRARLAEAYSYDAPLRFPASVGGQNVIISSMGYAFPDDSLVVEIARLIHIRQKSGVWGVNSELITKKGTWKATVTEDYLVLAHSSGETPLFESMFVSATGKIGIPAADAPKLDKLEPLLMSIEASLSPSGSRTPYIIIPK